jgi:hypothetical protein
VLCAVFRSRKPSLFVAFSIQGSSITKARRNETAARCY